MRAIDVVYAIRMLLDDSRDWYFPLIVNAINEAQLKKIREYYNQNNEMALRPLHSIARNIDPINPAITPILDFLYPRACRFYFSDGVTNQNVFIDATYLEPQKISQMAFPVFTPNNPFAFPPYAEFPKTAVYSVLERNNQWVLYAPWVSPQTRAELYYIRRPNPFRFSFDTSNRVIDLYGLEIDPLYHHEVVAYAAELLNNIDVLEFERSEAFNIYAGDKRLTIKSVFEVLQQKEG